MNIMQRFLGGVQVGALTITKSLTFATGVLGGAESATSGLVASTTQTLIGGTPLPSSINQVATSANSGNAVTLGIGLIPGQHQDVYNDGANPIKVFPVASTVAIDGGSAGASVPLANAKRCRYTCLAANVIESAQLGVVSA